MLCGINVRFQTVSPTQGQVAHALLTRPPLGIATSFDLNVLCTPPAFILSQDQTLEQIVSQVFRPKTFFLRVCDSFYLFWVCALHFCRTFLSKNFRDFRTRFCLYFYLLLFNFQWSIRCRSRAQPRYYTTSLPLCQEVFEKFFEKFQNLFSWSLLKGGSVVYYTTSLSTCQ